MANIVELRGKSGIKAYPITKAQAVYGSDGNTVNEKLFTDEASIASLKAQVASFTNLAEGSTTGDAELINARTTWYGTTASNAGDAIRTQTKNVVLVQQGQPTGDAGNANKIWVKPSSEELELAEQSEITELRDDLTLTNDLLVAGYDEVIWTQGGINAQIGSNVPVSNRLRSSGYKSYDNIPMVSVKCPQGYKIGVRFFTAPKNPPSEYFSGTIPSADIDNGYISSNIVFSPINDRYYRYVISRIDDADITPEEVPVDFSIELFKNVYDNINATINTIQNEIETEITQTQNQIAENANYDKNQINGLVDVQLTDSDTLSWTQGGINSEIGTNINSDTRIRSAGYQNYNGKTNVRVTCPSGYKIGIREFNSIEQPPSLYYERAIPESITFFNKDYFFTPIDGMYYRYVIAKDDDSVITPEEVPEGFKVLSFSKIPDTNPVLDMFTGNTGNSGILCAKEHHFVDGTAPTYEYYLIGDPITNKVYYSKDLVHKIYLFTFNDRLGYWSFGIDAVNNIICCKQAEYLANALEHDDSLRVNPIVYLAQEKYTIAHEVNISGLKPCGWLSSVGFICLANGECLISEYTRPVVETANIWKISGDPTNPASWSVKYTFNLSGGGTGFKHIHCVQQDFYNGVCYFGTGDDDTSSHVYYSLDNGDTWLIGKENSEKYCRLLNIIFTEDYTYWSTDSNKPNYHFIFKAPRLSNGVIDFDNITDLLEIPLVSGLATYGCVYFPGYEAILLLERSDGNKYTEAPIRVYDIKTNTLQTAYTLKSVRSGGGMLGFRTRFAQWYPKNNEVNLSWHLRGSSIGSDGFNENKMFGNQISSGDTSLTVNNAVLHLIKDNGVYKLVLNTRYI